MRIENGSVMKTLLLHLLIFLPALVLHNYEALEACCQTKTVSGVGSLDGVYRLEKNLNTKPDPVCEDGCVYIKQGAPRSQYCFRTSNQFSNITCSDTMTSTMVESYMTTDSSSG